MFCLIWVDKAPPIGVELYTSEARESPACRGSFPARTPLLQALIGFFELPEDDSTPDDEHFIDIEDTPGYQTAFSQLAFAGKKEHDPIGDSMGNPKILLAKSLHKLSTACPGRVRSQGFPQHLTAQAAA